MASVQPFIGQIELFGFGFTPRGWTACNGQLLFIADNNALFALLGTQYGGDGQNTFGVPNLNGRVAVGVGTGPGLSSVAQGQMGGAESVTLAAANLPAHSHTLAAQSGRGNTSLTGTSTVLALTAEDDGTPTRKYSSAGLNTALSSTSVGNSGGGQALSVRNPYLGMQYAIALEGIFPPQP
jgi:microcystin-dependent protein